MSHTLHRFSILIPTWNNLDYLKLCIKSIIRNSTYQHQLLVHVNEGADGTVDWLQEQGIEYVHSPRNIGICWALNGLRTLVKTDYILYMNDDMYVCPKWDEVLWDEIQKMPDNLFFLSSTLIQPRPFYCKSVIAPANFGEDVASFREEELLANYRTLQHQDWHGATWPPNVVHKSMWDLVGGYSIELSPGMYSDPDFSAKLWMAGVRTFKGLSESRVYHFEARSTGRVKKNNGSLQFLFKWNITSGSFVRHLLHRGEVFTPDTLSQINHRIVRKSVFRSKLKKIFFIFKKPGNARMLWE